VHRRAARRTPRTRSLCSLSAVLRQGRASSAWPFRAARWCLGRRGRRRVGLPRLARAAAARAASL